MVDISQKGKGAKREKFKLRHLLRPRLQEKHILTAPKIDSLAISKMFPVKDQGTSGSCGGQAWSSYMERLKYIRDNTIVPLSAKDIYSHAYTAPEGSDEGHLISQVENEGAAYESEVPSYDNGNPPNEQFMESKTVPPTDNHYNQMAINPKTFNGNDINQVKMAIDSGAGCVVALEGNNPCWTAQNGVVEIPDVNQLEWGHWLDLVAYDDLKQLVTAKNSWGKDAGDNGYYYIPYGYFSGNRVYGEWVFTLAPAGEYRTLLEKIRDLLQNIIDKIKNKT